MSDERRPSEAGTGPALPPPPATMPRQDGTGAPPPRSYTPPRPMDAPTDIMMTLVSAGLFLYVGFGMGGLVGISSSAIYNGSVTALVWGARIIGIGILGGAALSYMRIPGAVFLDLVISAAATALCVGVGAIWLQHGDTQGVLLLIFALVNAGATRGAWLRWRGTRGGAY